MEIGRKIAQEKVNNYLDFFLQLIFICLMCASVERSTLWFFKAQTSLFYEVDTLIKQNTFLFYELVDE